MYLACAWRATESLLTSRGTYLCDVARSWNATTPRPMPAQLRLGSLVSKTAGTTPTRVSPDDACLEQDTKARMEAAAISAANRLRRKVLSCRQASKGLRGAGHQLQKSGFGLQRGEFRHVRDLLPFLHAFLQSLTQIA